MLSHLDDEEVCHLGAVDVGVIAIRFVDIRSLHREEDACRDEEYFYILPSL